MIGLSMHEKPDYLFLTVIHVDATLFAFLVHSTWMEFFSKLRLSWHVPSEPVIEGRFLDEIYKDLMARAVKSVRRSGGGVMSVDSATDNLAQSKSNVILSR